MGGPRLLPRDRECCISQDADLEPNQRFGPMVNIQQYYAPNGSPARRRTGERTRRRALVDSCWSGLTIQTGDRRRRHCQRRWRRISIQADWVIACDGSRSTVRELTGCN